MTTRKSIRDAEWQSWRALFATRRIRPLPNPFAAEPQLAGVPTSLARSLAIFQLGESGGGTVVKQARRSRIAAAGDGYADALALFVAEEHHHAELLACAVRMLGGKLIRGNWTAKLFVAGRRLMGLRLKVTVLLVAEIVGICFYQAIASRLPASSLRSLLETIVADEASHLDFHCCFLRTQTAGRWRSALFRLVWRTLSRVTALVVLFDHRHALRDLGIERAAIWRRWLATSRHAELLATSDDWEPCASWMAARKPPRPPLAIGVAKRALTNV
ncbi:MAG: ferritin-like domain-containing protein [Pseudomonadota bacterium]